MKVYPLKYYGNLPATESPSCLQTTFASVKVHPVWQTVPHALFLQISTRPSNRVLPSNSLTSPSMHPSEYIKLYWRDETLRCQLPDKHLTPASRECVQEFSSTNSDVQFISILSVPVHVTLDNHIVPVPSPKLA